MSMREFLEGDCGQNPVLKVAAHFTPKRDELHSHSLPPIQGPSSFHQVQTTFRMEDLLHEIQAMEHQHQQQGKPAAGPSVSALMASHPEWAEEFVRIQGEEKKEEGNGVQVHPWIQEYMAKDPEFDGVWSPLAMTMEGGRVVSEMHPFMLERQFPVYGVASAKELLDDRHWVEESQSHENQAAAPLEKTELMITAEEFLKSVSDPKIRASEFMQYVEKLSTGEIAPNGERTEERSAEWVSEYENDVEVNASTSANADWASEYSAQATGEERQPLQTEKEKEEFWQKLNDEWERLAQEDAPNHPWLESPSSSRLAEPYKFTEENSFQDMEDPFAEGKRKLEEGDIPSAVLLFEAAVRKDADSAEKWLYLGTTQALNEQDLLSIAALSKCLDLEPGRQEALMSLATSLTNESFHRQACDALKRWLRMNEKYAHLLPEEVGGASLPATTSLLPAEELENVQRLFIQAARLNLGDGAGVDPDVQCGLGILFNLGSDFDKAADCFQAAVNVTPNNPMLWNRLGATLANGGKSSEAISAYRHALRLSPMYIRTRYNLGIACVNLGAYREAAEHFLTALNMQSTAKPSSSSSTTSQKNTAMSDSIWSSLRTSLHLSDLSHLSRLIDTRNLEQLNREFEIISGPSTL